MFQTGQKHHFIFLALLKLLLRLCKSIANVVCLQHTQSFFYYTCTVQKLRSDVAEREVHILCLLLQKKRHIRFVKAGNHWYYNDQLCLRLVSLFFFWTVLTATERSGFKGVLLNIFCLYQFDEERRTQYYFWVNFLPRDSGLIATLHKVFFCFLFFWVAIYVTLF